MRYVANLEVTEVPGFEEIAEFVLDIEYDIDTDMGEAYVEGWSIEAINDKTVEGDETLTKLAEVIMSKYLDHYTIEAAILEAYFS